MLVCASPGPQAGFHPARRAPGWDLRDPDQRARRAPERRGLGALVQAAEPGGTCLPLSQGDRLAGAADPPPVERPSPCPHPAMPVGLLCGVAPPPGVEVPVIRG